MDMPMTASPDAAGVSSESEGEAKVEITLCVYPGGKLAIKVDGGNPIPVESLDQALQGIKAFAEQEAGEGSEGLEKGSGPVGASEQAEGEQAFASGYKSTRGM